MNRSQELVYNRKIILYSYLTFISLITVIGIGGNCLVIFVVAKFSKMQSITNIQILSLAIADLLHLTAIPQLLLQITGHSFLPSNIACMAYCFISHVNWFAGTLTLTMMSFDRFLAVIYPYRSQHFRCPKNAVIIVIITWILSIILMIPTFINAKVGNFNSSKKICIQKWPNSNAEFALLPTISYTFFFGYAMPGLLILSFYLAIIYRLRNLRLKNKERKNSVTSSNKTTLLVLAIVIVFIACNLPYWINQWIVIISHQHKLNKFKIAKNLLNQGLRNHTLVKNYFISQKNSMTFNKIMITYLCQMTSYLTSALNPVLYSFLSAQFRASFASVITGNCLEKFNLHVDFKSHGKYTSAKQKSISTLYDNSKRNHSKFHANDDCNNMSNVLELFETNV